MAAATISVSDLAFSMGNKRVSTATLTSVANTNTFDTALSRIDTVQTQVNTLTDSAGGTLIKTTVSSGTVTFVVEGTMDTIYVTAIGT